MKEKRGNRVKEARLEKAIRSKFQNSNNSDINAKIGVFHSKFFNHVKSAEEHKRKLS